MPYVLAAIVAAAFMGYIWSLIFWKAGWGRWTGLLMLVPVVNALMLITLAFGRWPVHDRVEMLEHQLAELERRP